MIHRPARRLPVASALAGWLLAHCGTDSADLSTPDRGADAQDGLPDTSTGSIFGDVESEGDGGDTRPQADAGDDVPGVSDTGAPDTLGQDGDTVESDGQGVDVSPQDTSATDTSTIDTAGADTAAGDTAAGDTGTDPACDRDDDGVLAPECGGDDCNDRNGFVAPGRAEACDFVDNNCDGSVNEGLDCSFYAHTPDSIYRIDPFLGGSRFIMDTPTTFWDMDTDTDGTLWGIGPSGLARFDAGSSAWETVTGLDGIAGTRPNGFAINSSNVAYLTTGSQVYTLVLPSGTASLLGDVGGGYVSSGDCVVDKGDAIYMSSTGNSSSRGDLLVAIDGARATATLVGDIGYTGVYGLTAAWGFLFGTDSSGHVIEINPTTGTGTIAQTFSGRVWYGAASTPDR